MSATEAVPIDARSDEAAAERARAGGTPSRGADRFAMVAVVFTGAIFGFFYAWVCSTMWGLDDADPRVAIDAMQAMNASVRNAVFFPAFFLTPVVLGAAAVLLHRTERTEAGRWFVAAALVYLLGGLVLTMVVNVPMNEDLALVSGPLTDADAADIWADYSGPGSAGMLCGPSPAVWRSRWLPTASVGPHGPPTDGNKQAA